MITINIQKETIGKINVPTSVTANITSDKQIKNIQWIANKPVHFTNSLDNKTINFTPSENGDYVFTITVWDVDGYRASATTGIIIGAIAPVPTPQPTPSPSPQPQPTPSVGVLFDSRINTKLHDGIKRTITKEGIIECRASGNPKIQVNEDKTFSLITGTQVIDNLSIRNQERHNIDGECAKRFGGFGTSIHNSSVEFKTESCHNNHENAITRDSNINIRDGKFHKIIFEKKEVNGIVEFKTTLDGQVSTGKHSNPKAYYLDKNLYLNDYSGFWYRANNDDNGRFYISCRNYNSQNECSVRFDNKNSVTFQYIVIRAI